MSTPLSLQMISEIMPNAEANGLHQEWGYLLKTLSDYEINTKNRVAAFLGNVAAESGELYYVEEIADGWAYEGRAELGNIYEGDGPRFKGHGYIQITGRNNHKAVGDALGVDAISDPAILSRMPYAWYSAGWYWRYGSSWGNLNDMADEGNYDGTVLGVRGGPDPNRTHYWWDAMEALPDDLEIPGGSETVTDWPERKIGFNKEGWALDLETNAWIKSDRKDATLYTNTDGWLWGQPVKEETTWDWPTADDEPTAGDYLARHPTRYTWRDDVDAWARYLVDNYDVWCNTYYDHPEGYWRTEDSIDVWGPAGRGDPINPALGDEIFNLLFSNPAKPDIDWIIWRRYIYGAWNGWAGEFFGDGSAFTNHEDHIHCTYARGG